MTLPEPYRPTVLVVDDQPVNVQSLYQVFAEDHQVLMAMRGEQALKLCASRQPDLVLLDVEMPDMDGYEVCRRLKADPLTREIPVIFVTAHHDEAAETRGLDLGAVDFISKPINPRIVRARARTHLTLKAQSDLLRRQAHVDGLTGVFNRRLFDERLHTEWARAARTGAPLGVVLLDVDHFKRFNDHHGHQAGDDCLRRVAVALQAGLKRPGDLLARYGGEEFVCLLPDTDAAGALSVAQALCERVAAEAIPHGNSPVSPTVTISAGSCGSQDVGSFAMDALLRGADSRLYAAKEAGRQCALGAELDESVQVVPLAPAA